MSNVIKLKKGLDIPIKGEPAYNLEYVTKPETFAIKPSDFLGLIPKLHVKVGDKVKAGTTLFVDKYSPEIQYVSSTSGEVVAVNRGERRKILEVVIKDDRENLSEDFLQANPKDLCADEIKVELLKSGLWPSIKSRPYGVVAKPDDQPKAIFISCFDSSPLAPNYDFVFKDEAKAWQTGIDALKKLTSGNIHLGLSLKKENKIFKQTEGVEISYFDGPHPAGNVGIQIHAISPLNKGEIVWTLQPHAVVMIGRLFLTGKYDSSRIIALVGSEVKEPKYYHFWLGGCLCGLLKGKLSKQKVRVINGNVLTGTTSGSEDFLGFYDTMVTVIPEGNYYEMFGWALPGFGKYSPSRTFFSWLRFGKKKYILDSNTHGEERAFVLSDEYDKVLPMDILPVYLLKAILVNDIDAMEQLGIYEVIEEDFALCEYICTSKINVQSILRKGINSMIKELV
ncbi:MAG: Na(+)-translocating NADH-quinone reductase subunit A [Mariniphaga sp.]